MSAHGKAVISKLLMVSAMGPWQMFAVDPRPADQPLTAATVKHVDVCIYAATPGGILAAVAVKREGKSVVIVEPSRWVGGILGAGLKPMQDCPNYAATGGMTRELLRTLGSPDWQGQEPRGIGTVLNHMSPKAVREDFSNLLSQWDIPVVFDHRVVQCEKVGATITAAIFDRAPFDDLGCPVAEPEQKNSVRVEANVFIDAGYEGDLMARAGVSYQIGRESIDTYEETYAGARAPTIGAPIDPFIVPGQPDSGLLNGVEEDHGLAEGMADQYSQAYNYRYYTTSDPAHRKPFTPPEGYDPKAYELVGRYVAHLVETIDDSIALRTRLTGIFPGWMNAGEWNYQRNALISMAPVGVSHLYAGGHYEDRARIWKMHQDYLRGLHTFMSTDPRVPEAYRREVSALGLDGRHHPETHGWPHQLYVRVGRRMRGRYVVTTHDVYNRTVVEDPIALAQYGVDTYPARRIWMEREGQVWVAVEGNMFVGGARGPTNMPYPIPYRAITPHENECDNLLVPVSLSASHLGYASARMEPVFMMCGESAGIAAVMAVNEQVAVQHIDAMRYREALKAAGQKLVWETDGSPTPQDTVYSYVHLLETCDLDGDGLVSRSEWNKGKRGWEWLFPRIDTNNDGHIDAAEYEAFQEYKQTNPQWRRERPFTENPT